MGPNSNGWCPLQKREATEKVMWGWRRGLSYAAISQHQGHPEGKGLQRKHGPADFLLGKNQRVALRCPACGHLLWEPWETSTMGFELSGHLQKGRKLWAGDLHWAHQSTPLCRDSSVRRYSGTHRNLYLIYSFCWQTAWIESWSTTSWIWGFGQVTPTLPSFFHL